MSTAVKRFTNIAEKIMDYKTDDLRNVLGSQLIVAATDGDNVEIKRLLKEGAKAEYTGKEALVNYSEGMALMKAAAYGYLEVVKTLLNENPDFGILRMPLLHAQYRNHNEVEALIKDAMTRLNPNHADNPTPQY